MFAFSPRKETVYSVLLIAVILLNALSPIPVLANTMDDPQADASSTDNKDISLGLTMGMRKFIVEDEVPILSEQIAQQAQQNQEEKPVKFKVWADPAIYIPGKSIELYWKVQNLKDMENAQVVIHAPEGLTPADPNPTLTTDGLVSIPLRDKKDVTSWNVEDGVELPIYFGIDLLVNDDLIVSETVMVDQAHFSVEKSKGGNFKSSNGKVEVEVPAAAINETLDFDVREPAPQSQPGVSLTWNPIEIIAVGKNSQKNVDKFKSPIKIKVKYDETQIFDWDENALTLYYYDPDLLDWFPIETTVDAKNNTLTAYSDHLTVFDYKANNWQSQMVPTVDGFKVSDFTGAGTYAVNFWTPPAPGGLQPPLTLSYNSQVIDESSAFSQPSWVGMGWTLDTGSVTRNMHGTDSDNGQMNDDTFIISVGGISGQLLPVSIDASGEVTTYNTADQSFIKVVGDNIAYKFTAWTKDGTKYEFEHITSVNLSQGCPPPSAGTPTTWRWSLTKVTDVHGNTMSYAYNNEIKPNCLNEIAVYPTSITYGYGNQYANGKYRVNFVRDTVRRTDYQLSWASSTSRTLYSTYRLKEVQIQQNVSGSWSNIRRYVLSYAPNDSTNIYPNFNWSAGGKTLTLVGIQEFGSDGSALPAVRFFYNGLRYDTDGVTLIPDNMHLTKVDNGQGGVVEITYSARWWYFDDVNKDLRSVNYHYGPIELPHPKDWFIYECYDGYLTISWTRYGGTGAVRCEGSPSHYMQVGGAGTAYRLAEAIHSIPENMVKPGARYRYRVQVRSADSTTRTFDWGFIDTTGTGTKQLLPQKSVGPVSGGQSFESSIEMPATFNPANINMYLSCDFCFFREVQLVLMPSWYFVAQRKVTVQPTGLSSTYQYNYWGTASNAADNSNALATYGNDALYTKTLREFRGHAMSEVVDPAGLATLTWFHQTDALKGRAYNNLTMQQTFYGLSSGWTTNGSVTGRTSASLSSGKIAIAHLKLSGTNPVGQITLTGSPAFTISLSSTSGASVNGTSLLSAGNFVADKEYGLMIFLDGANGYRVRLWQLTDPTKVGEVVIAGMGSGARTFSYSASVGTLSLGGYAEGIPYSESIMRYNTTVQYDTIAGNGITDLAVSSLLPFKDLQIAWNRVAWVEQRNYNGDAKYVGTKQVLTYDDGVVANGHYGNLVNTEEYSGNSSNTPVFALYRGAKAEYAAPNTTKYIVGLPVRQVTLDCTSGTCDFTNLTGKVAETYLFYDNNDLYTAAPTNGDLTRQRTWVQSGDYNQTSFAYDAYGSQTSVTTYTGYATATQTTNPTGAQTTYTCFGGGGTLGGQSCTSDNYHTYPLWTMNPLGQVTQTGYDYAFGLPNSVTDANGVTTQAAYDNFGRMTKIAAPGDSLAAPTLQIAYINYNAATNKPFQINLTQRVDGTAAIQLSRFYDGAGRQIQTQTVHALVNGTQQNVVVDYLYDSVGHLWKQSIPRATTNGTPLFVTPQDFSQSTVTTYDVLGRTLSVTQPNTNQVQYSYTDLTTTATDPKLYATTTTADVWGRTTRFDPPTGPAVGYIYDVKGQLLKAIRGTSTEVGNCLANPTTGCLASKTVSIAYDSAGRKLNMDDPDMGFWQYEYDALGNLQFQTDNRQCVLSLGYDDLNRLTSKNSSGAGCVNQVSTSYFYDGDNPATPSVYDPPTSGNTQIGRRTSMSDNSGSTVWVYDSRGRVQNETKIITGAASSFQTAWTYNSADLPVTMTYPDNEILTYGYNTDGSLNSVTSNLGGTTPYLASTKYDEAGRIKSMDYGNSVIQKAFTYFPFNTAIQGGLLNTAVTTRLSDSTSLQNFAYTYDKNANVSTIVDNLAGPQTQTFGYDSLNRLTSAVVTGGTEGLYNESYSYDSNTGNLSVKAGVTYTYDTNHPHAVASLTNGNSYVYDVNGNMTQRNVDALTFDLAYDAENRLVSVGSNATPPPPTVTPTSTVTSTPIASPTWTMTPTPSSVPTATAPTATATNLITNTPGATYTPTNPPTGTASPTATITQSGSFPSTSVLDDFNRANGSIGSNWTGYTSAYAIASNKLDVTTGGWDTYIFWGNTQLGANQEAYVTISQVDGDASEQDLLLKSQSNNSISGVIEVLYDANADVVQVWTFDGANGWVQHGTAISVAFNNGDQFGARAKANGDVEVYKNGILLGTRSVTSWPYYANGGYIGIWFANATGALLDDFGGGTLSQASAPFFTRVEQTNHGRGSFSFVNYIVPNKNTVVSSSKPFQQSGFPSTSVLDNFNRANGAIGANWAGATSGYSIASNQLDASSSADDIYWQGGSFGADQEAYITLTNVDPNGGEQDLLLKSQNPSGWTNGVLEVLYDATNDVVQVWTYSASQNWVQHGSDIPVTFNNGDQFGARAKANGDVEVYKNGTLLGTRNVSSWQYYASGGYIGLWFIDAADAVLDDFGGGNVSSGPTATPTSTQPAPTATFTSTPVLPTATSTNTPVVPTATNTPLPTATMSITPTFTHTATPTVTSTYCAQATPEPLLVEPVTSPTGQLTQVITVYAGNSDSVTVTLETGSFTVNGNFSTSSPALVTVTLQENTVHHLTVSAHIKEINMGGCVYGGYTLSTTNDRYGSPLTITTDNPSTPPPASVFLNAAFTYDGDGIRVKSVSTTNIATTTTYFAGTHYEVTNGVVTKYYYAGAQRIAMRQNGDLKFLLGDHLGSTSLVTDANGYNSIETRYTAWGEVRYASGEMPTKYSFTGQRSYLSDFGLMFYNARWLDVSLGRFAQADSIVAGGIQGLDRYAYVNNAPTRFIDPSGHRCVPEDECDTPHGDLQPDPYSLSQSDIKNVINAEPDYEYWLYLGIRSVDQMRNKSGWWTPYLNANNGMDVWKFLLKLAYTMEAYSIPGNHSSEFTKYMTDAFVNKAGDFYQRFGIAGLYLFLGTREAFTDRASLDSQAENWIEGNINYRNTWEFGPGADKLKLAGEALYTPKADSMYPLAAQEINKAWGAILNYTGADLYGTGAIDVGVDPPLPMAGKNVIWQLSVNDVANPWTGSLSYTIYAIGK